MLYSVQSHAMRCELPVLHPCDAMQLLMIHRSLHVMQVASNLPYPIQVTIFTFLFHPSYTPNINKHFHFPNTRDTSQHQLPSCGDPQLPHPIADTARIQSGGADTTTSSDILSIHLRPSSRVGGSLSKRHDGPNSPLAKARFCPTTHTPRFEILISVFREV